MSVNWSLKGSIAAAALAVLGMPTQAATLSLPSQGTFEDNNVEYVIGADGNLKTGGTLVVGDVFYAFVTFDAIRLANNDIWADFGVGSLQVNGVSAVEIASIDPVTGVVTMKAYAPFEATYGTGALAALYINDPGTFDVNCQQGGIATCEGQATAGDLWAVAGFGDLSDFWFVSPTLGGTSTNLTTIANGNAGTKYAAANYGLSVLTNNTGYTFGQQECNLCADGFAQIIGSGDVLGGAGLTRPFVARSDFDFTFATTEVPEPGALSLAALGLLGVGFASRRKQRQ